MGTVLRSSYAIGILNTMSINFDLKFNLNVRKEEYRIRKKKN